MTKKIKAPSLNSNVNLLGSLIKIGKSKTISTSKIKKIIANRKNRKEKGRRADLIGSKPHSKGDSFSRSPIARLERINPKLITTIDNNKATTLLNSPLNINTSTKDNKSYINQHQ